MDINSQIIENLKIALNKALFECERLKKENEEFRKQLGLRNHFTQPSSLASNNSSPVEKIALFRSLFKGRDDVYAVRWEGKNGHSGYAPACANEWDPQVCKKPSVSCTDCKFRALLPLTDQVIYDHLAGKHSIGMYPLLSDETCWFLAADFDGKMWKSDSITFFHTCKELEIPAVIEKSRSGNGAHVWIFFEEPIVASVARKLGFVILQQAKKKVQTSGFDSYDRFFPNQDTMPKGGFGNLIALPLQGLSRKNGNTIFINDNFRAYNDQWHLLSTIKKINLHDVKHLIQRSDFGTIPSQNSMIQVMSSTYPVPSSVTIHQRNMLFIRKQGLPHALLEKMKQIAAFPNPEYYKAQRLRLSTSGKPRMIECAEESADYIALPRGCMNEFLELMKTHEIEIHEVDERNSGIPINASFQGELRPLQEEAAQALLAHDKGVLAATTAFGKTVLAAYLISARKVNTLILVHRKQLLEQWKEKLSVFLDISIESIGVIGGGKSKRTGVVDIAIIQSVGFKGQIKDFIKDYGQVIVDECHHVSAIGFEQVLKEINAKYVNGLTATPTRKDGLHPIITMQCGPIRYRVNPREQAVISPFDHIVIPRYTEFDSNSEPDGKSIQEIYAGLVNDEQRNDQIFDDVLLALEAGRSPLLLSERTSHVEYFAKRLKSFAKNVIVLQGGMGRKQIQSVLASVSSIPDNEERVLIATGRFIGEGFDDPRLDTLFLTMPISWKGTLQQYAGRLHRLHDHKEDVHIYDYVDSHVPILQKMFEKRLKGYKTMGYEVKEIHELGNEKRMKQLRLF
jgi:superfamily II DNA or RNA helicase